MISDNLFIPQALLGASVDVLTLGGMVEVKVPPGTLPDSRVVLKGKGVPHPEGGGRAQR